MILKGGDPVPSCYLREQLEESVIRGAPWQPTSENCLHRRTTSRSGKARQRTNKVASHELCLTAATREPS